MSISDVARRLGRLELRIAAQAALHGQAHMLAAVVRGAQARPRGDASGATARETQERIDVSLAGDVVVIGLRSRSALERELGTVGTAPQPLLGMAAAEHVAGVGEAVGAAVAEALRRG